MKVKTALLSILTVLVLLGTPGLLFATNGHFLHGVGAVNDAMGGAATAGNPQDLLGSLHRNPANGNLFDGRVASASLGALFPKVTVNTSVAALCLSGSSDSDVDVIPFANFGMVFNDESTPTAYYFAVISEAGFDQNGALTGLGWDDIWVVGLGVQHNLTDDLTLRAGYKYCTNPIDEDVTFFNVGSPLHAKHLLSLGGSYRITKQVIFDISYSHVFESSQQGPWYDMNGPAAGLKLKPNWKSTRFH